ncbi:MAG: methyltransferase domain-containing protein [Chitinispirillales bacterium]|jgi:hypothetical protein|nr:methyltransferase domain-containing protein [Chitinispirillales bacterium]
MGMSRNLQQKIWPLIPLPLGLKRALWHKLFFKKNNFAYKDDDTKNVFSKIYTDNFWLSKESRSGGGSLISTTKTIREKLPVIWEQYGVKTFLDVPCGDYNWMKEVEKKNITYIGGDIVDKLVEQNNEKYSSGNVSFKVIDITKDEIPTVDMILCKDCLQHLSYEKIFKALRNFKNSKSKYLLTTSYSGTIYNWDILDGDCRPLNLRKKPFCLPEPIMKIREKSRGVQVDSDKDLYLYRIDDFDFKDEAKP